MRSPQRKAVENNLKNCLPIFMYFIKIKFILLFLLNEYNSNILLNFHLWTIKYLFLCILQGISSTHALFKFWTFSSFYNMNTQSYNI